ncbi:hypothetical protein [Secundilactobacillus folii]|uniref:Uncharacterized protein n=1 Tax=Secundilactobacillus folii TaxID=2678357 RepID=A0A7X2XVP5_9LACO|nr:hypothetical protein [Secundilactobacillus folii]MTV82481.1 hypothetical protein [Secundilactobacillus folii]
MTVINFSGHPAVQNAIVNQLNQTGESVAPEVMMHFRAMAHAHDVLFGDQMMVSEHVDA